ncbi:MAG: hypothetical protein ACTHYR_04255 [Brachybacterium sp.]
MRHDWPAMMDVSDIAEFSGWTKLTILNWIKDGTMTGALTLSSAPKATILIPREIVFAQLDPRNDAIEQA